MGVSNEKRCKNSDRSEHVETLARKLVEKGFQSVEIIDAIYWKHPNPKGEFGPTLFYTFAH